MIEQYNVSILKKAREKPTRWPDENTIFTIEHIHSRRQSKCEGHPLDGESNDFLLKGSWLQTRIYFRYSERRTTYIYENSILLNENNWGKSKVIELSSELSR